VNRIALPGTHNSGTYDLTRYGIGDTFQNLSPDLSDKRLRLAKAIIGLGDTPILPAAVISASGSDIFHGWSECQERPILQQLQDGIRSLDFRVCTDKNGTMRICHGEMGPTVDTVLNDLKRFATEHPTEIVVIRFTHFYSFASGSGNEMLHNRLRAAILAKLQGHIVPNSLHPNS
jgi:hypothetical protein